jgi:hypothetical protein
MINIIGKTLVVIHVALSVLAMTWAAALLLQFVDWGWKQPRLDVNERVPSELDKRTAAVNEAVRAQKMALAPVKKSKEDLFGAMSRYAQNHLYYRNELEKLRSYQGDAALVVKEPLTNQNVEGVDKSIVQYEKVLQGLQADNDKLVKENRDWTAKAQQITMQLGGLDETGKKVKVGLYDLLENEAQMQARIRFEKDYIQPQWAEALEQAQQFRERREGLQRALDRLQGDLGKRGKK